MFHFHGSVLNNITRLTVSFSKPNGDSFTFGNDLVSSGGANVAVSAVTSKAISEGGKSDYAIITTDAHSLTEGQAIRISGINKTESAANDLNGDHIIKEVLSNTSLMLETSYTGDAAVNTLGGFVDTEASDTVCDVMQHTMTFRIGALVEEM